MLKSQASSEGVEIDSVRLQEGKDQSPSCLTTMVLSKNICHATAEDLLASVQVLQQLIKLKVVDNREGGE